MQIFDVFRDSLNLQVWIMKQPYIRWIAKKIYFGEGGEGLLLFSEKVFSGKWELFHKKS